MGYATSSIRLLYLTQLKNDLEHRIMLITESKLDMSKTITELIEVGTNLDPDSPIVKNMKARRDKLKLMEQQLDQQLEEARTKLNAVNTEIESARGLVQDGIRNSFNYGVGRH